MTMKRVEVTAAAAFESDEQRLRTLSTNRSD